MLEVTEEAREGLKQHLAERQTDLSVRVVFSGG